LLARGREAVWRRGSGRFLFFYYFLGSPTKGFIFLLNFLCSIGVYWVDSTTELKQLSLPIDFAYLIQTDEV